jgi:hypothetical protein
MKFCGSVLYMRLMKTGSVRVMFLLNGCKLINVSVFIIWVKIWYEWLKRNDVYLGVS